MKLSQSHGARTFSRRLRVISVLAIIAAWMSVHAVAQQLTLQLAPLKSSIKFTVGDVLHTVRGTFTVSKGTIEFEPDSGKMAGEIVVDAKSGNSGNGMRDRKMHKEVLESESYPEVVFEPTLAEGGTADGKFATKIHGVFSIHGVKREIIVPAEVEIVEDLWSANVHFTIPYAKWGMKNPSTLFLRVNDYVEIDLAVAGSVVRQHGDNRARVQ